MTDDPIPTIVAERAIVRVVHAYTRAVDRFDWELLRACYWPDATDHHGTFVGGVEAFVAYLQKLMPRWQATAHQLGQTLLDLDLPRGLAAAETYATATHVSATDDGAVEQMIAGIRYADRFERRDGEWRIAERVVLFDWHRTVPVTGRLGFAPGSIRGERSRADLAYHMLD